jgi:hypothetical protein
VRFNSLPAALSQVMTPTCYIVAISAATAACASAPPTTGTVVAPRSAAAIAATRDAVWSAALAALADRSLPVKSSDKAGGVITTEEAVVSATDDRKQAGACEKVLGMPLRPNRAQYTIAVAGDNPTTVRVSTRLTLVEQNRVSECASSGFLEGQLEAAVKTRAEGR